MSDTANMKLVLFFTRGVSLETWSRVGMFDREVSLYQRLQEKGCEISFVTYGGPSELQYQNQIPGIKILCNTWHLPQAIYQKFLPYLHGSTLREADIYKTNQTDGADIALHAAHVWKKPLIARCGYMWSLNLSREHGEFSVKAQRAKAIESMVFQKANRIVVTTPAMAEDINLRIPGVTEKTIIIPNYVETERFYPFEKKTHMYDVIFIGRISAEKNLKALLDAVQSLSVKTAIIGEGELRPSFQQEYSRSKDMISFLGNVPNSDLPNYLNQASLFILPSLYEGHPKTLLEAMACGIAVIGTNSPGIREIIKHGENGWLCETDSESIKNAISYLLSNPVLCEKLGETARKYALDTVSLNRIIDMEIDLYRSVLGERSDTN